MSGQVVVGVDGTEGGWRALAWALRQAAASGGHVLVASVYYDPAAPDREPSDRAKGARRDAERHLRTDLAAALDGFADPPPIETVVVAGGVTAHVLADLAEYADLLVVGSHGHGVMSSRLIGTVSQGCVGSAVCPVVVVPARDKGVGPSPVGAMVGRTEPFSHLPPSP